MQSSPPVRGGAWPEPPSSPNPSLYSLDLAALDLESDESSTPLASKQQPIQRILSEDIDGPTDFTINMGMWMRGGIRDATRGRGTADEIGKKNEKHDDNQSNVEDAQDNLEEHRDGDIILPRKSNGDDEDDQATQSRHTPTNTPPRESVWNDRTAMPRNADRDLQQSDSDGDESNKSKITKSNSAAVPGAEGAEIESAAVTAAEPDAGATPPHPPAHAHFPLHQPTVEDYHSELLPPNAPSTMPRDRRPALPPPSHTTGDERTDRNKSTARLEAQSQLPSSPGRPSSPTLSPVRSPVVRRSMRENAGGAGASADADVRNEALEDEVRRLQLRCRQLEEWNGALRRARLRDQQQQEREREERAAFEAGEEDENDGEELTPAGRSHELLEPKHGEVEIRKRSQNVQDEQSKQAEAREQRLRILELHAGRHGDELAAMRDGHAAKMNEANAEMQLVKAEYELKLRTAGAELELARRARDDAEEVARVHREELEEFQKTWDSESHTLRRRLEEQKHAHSARVAALQDQLKAAEVEKVNLRAQKLAAEDDTAAAQGKHRNIETSQNSAAESAAHAKCCELSERTHRELQMLQRELQAYQQTQHTNETLLALLQQQASQAITDTSPPLVTHSASQESQQAQQALLNTALLDRDAAHDTLISTLNERIEELKQQLQDRDAVSLALDQKFADAARRREAYWRSRLGQSESERKLVGKALLHAWGREEVGVTVAGATRGEGARGKGQGYAFVTPREIRESS